MGTLDLGHACTAPSPAFFWSRALPPHIFEPFRSAAQKECRRSSFGLGLYIVHEIVRAHGGDISVVSDVNTGTTFRMTLPRT